MAKPVPCRMPKRRVNAFIDHLDRLIPRLREWRENKTLRCEEHEHLNYFCPDCRLLLLESELRWMREYLRHEKQF